MKPIEIDQFRKFTFLSGLTLSENGRRLFFVRSRMDMKKNGYQQRLYEYDTEKGTRNPITPWKKSVHYFTDESELYMLESDPKIKGPNTMIVHQQENGKVTLCTLPLSVSRMIRFGDDYYLAIAGTTRNCPDYHLLSQSQREEYLKEVEDNSDYIVLDEYPFVFNGAGVINGNRSSLFLINRHDWTFTRISSETCDVDGVDVINGRIIYFGVDFTAFRSNRPTIWEYDPSTGSSKTLYDGDMIIRKVFNHHERIYVQGTFGKDFGDMEASKFYELVDGRMELRIDNEDSFYNSVATDCHYGASKQYDRVNDENWFINTSGYRSLLLRMEEDHFSSQVTVDGSVDDFAIASDRIYVIASIRQNLQELYQYRNGRLKKLTSFNDSSLRGYYVSVPEHIVVQKATNIDGWVMKPINYDPEKKYPAILDIHGGPKAAYGELFYHEMQYWTSKGYFVIYCNPRGSDGKGNVFADLRHQFGGIDYQDIMAFVDLAIETYPAIDADRMGVTGGSYGGYMTNWIVCMTDRFKAAATQRSISNWITEVGVSDYGIDFPMEQQYGDIYNCADEMWSVSPLKYVNKANTPMLFIHSTEDYRCPVPEALQFYTALTCRGVETRMVLFKGENHNLSRNGKPLHRIRRLREITEWMDKHLMKG